MPQVESRNQRYKTMTASILLGLLLLGQSVFPEVGEQPRPGNPRGYETDILLETFDYGPKDIDAEINRVYQGCAARDCIPSIDQPRFQAANDVDFLDSDDLVLSVSLGGDTRAYPTRILDRHEIVNDRFAETPVAVTYCPLCGSGLAFVRQLDGEETEFGVSGLLHNNDLIMYDRKTFSLWQQITGRALAGPKRGEVLETVPLTMSAWEDWRAVNPEGMVLLPPNGPEKYEKNTYGDYATSDKLLFPVKVSDARLHAKKVIFGLQLDQQAIAVESGWLLEQGGWEYQIDGKLLRLKVDAAAGVSADLDGKALAVHRMYWFAWYSFHPDTSLINSKNH